MEFIFVLTQFIRLLEELLTSIIFNASCKQTPYTNFLGDNEPIFREEQYLLDYFTYL